MDADFQGLIRGSLGTSAQVRIYRQAVLRIEQEIQHNNESEIKFGDGSTAGRKSEVKGQVTHTGSGTQYSSPTAPEDFGGGAQIDFSADSGAMLNSDEIEVGNTLAHIESLGDVIVFTFGKQGDVAGYILDQLTAHSPVRTGRYLHSHVIFADGVLVEDIAHIPDMADTSEFLIVNTIPYARKIEQGESAMAPNGVYEIVAMEADKKYGSVCIIEFIDYAGTYGVMAQATTASHGRRTRRHMNKSENRFPAIRVTFPHR